MPRESSLTDELRLLLHSRRTAALGTVGDDGAPFVSMIPFAVEPSLGCLIIHVSDLAAHTRYLRDRPKVSVLVMQHEQPGEPVHALPRATLGATPTCWRATGRSGSCAEPHTWRAFLRQSP